ncbi:hypothetical protein D3C76_631700 [compost metagenome]
MVEISQARCAAPARRGGNRCSGPRGLLRAAASRRSIGLHRPTEGRQGIPAEWRSARQHRGVRKGRRRSGQSPDPVDGKCPAAQGTAVIQDSHQRQAEPAVRRAAVHPAIAAVRGVRSGALRAQPQSLSGRLPGAETGPGAGAGPCRCPQLPFRRRDRCLPRAVRAVPVAERILQRPRPQPVGSADQRLPQACGVLPRRRPSAGTRLGAPALQRVLPAGPVQDRADGRPRQWRRA